MPDDTLTPEAAANNTEALITDPNDRGDAAAPAADGASATPADGAATPAAGDGAPAGDGVASDTAADAPATPPAPSKDSGMIPRSRYNEAAQRRREAEARAEQLEAELARARAAAPQPTEMDRLSARVNSLYEQVENARAEGDSKTAAALSREIDNINRQLTRFETDFIAQQRAVAAQNLAAYNAVVDQLELVAPQLDPNSDDFDEEAAVELDAMVRGFEQRLQLSPADALKRAARRMFGDGVFTRTTTVAPASPPARPTNVPKNVDAANRQPPTRSVPEPPERRVDIDIEKLSDAEYAKLPESTKKRLRGDLL